MPSFLINMNAYQCEQFQKFYQLHGVKIPYKYVEKALLCDTTCDFEEFYNCILDYIKVADLAEKTMIKYEHYFYNQQPHIFYVWRELKNIL